MFKRSVDFVLAGVFFVLSLPVLAVAAIAIKLDSEGPVLFSQLRMGRGFKRFRIWKLRTMHVCDDGPDFTVCRDARVTNVGRYLRRCKVDELPQLWNVMRGDMSLVGPRPVVPKLIEGFEQAYGRLLQVRPGLTDPATIKYCREEEYLSLVANEERYFKEVLIPDKLRISAAYLDRANTLGDVSVLVETVLALLPGGRKMRSMGGWVMEKSGVGRLMLLRDARPTKGLPSAGEM